MKQYRIAAIFMMIHGGLMELGGALCMIPCLVFADGQFDASQYISFRLPYFQDNLPMIMVMGAMYGILRLIGAVGLWKGRMWGLALSVINCVVTLALMMFLLPAGIMDGLLAGAALLLILTRYFGKKTIPV